MVEPIGENGLLEFNLSFYFFPIFAFFLENRIVQNILFINYIITEI